MTLPDPRWYQITALSLLLAFGVLRLGFGVSPLCILITMGSALATQYACSRWLRLPAFDPKSALITSLSLCILLRSNSLAVLAAAAILAVGSKFLLRVRGKHVFNPANIAISSCVASGVAWISPAQWGSAAWFAFLFACLGMVVVTRARRSDVTFAFLLCYIGLIFARALWLGDPLAIPIKQIQSGALLLFAFFMISDPKTTPDAPLYRILFGALVAMLAFTLQFTFYIPQGLVYSLTLMSPLTILLDRLHSAPRYEWNPPPSHTTFREAL